MSRPALMRAAIAGAVAWRFRRAGSRAPRPAPRTGGKEAGLLRAGVAGCFLLAFMPAPDPHAQRIDRLFSTPEQRAVLDGMRDDPAFGRKPAPAAAAAGPGPAADADPEPMPDPAAPAVTINGIVLRGGVQRVSWINGVAVDAGAAAPGGIRIDAGRVPDGRFRVRLPDGRSTIDLKPGQKAGVVKGRVLDAYEHAPAQDGAAAPGGRTVIGSGAAAPPPEGVTAGDLEGAGVSSPFSARRTAGGATAEAAAASATPVPSTGTAVAAPDTGSDGPAGRAPPPALPASLLRALLRQAGVVPTVPPARTDAPRARHE